MEDNEEREKSVCFEGDPVKEVEHEEKPEEPAPNPCASMVAEDPVAVDLKKQPKKKKPQRFSVTPRPRTDKYSILVEKETKRLIMLQPTAGQAVRFELVLGSTFYNLKCLPKPPVFTQREADRLDRLLTDDSGGLFPPKQF